MRSSEPMLLSRKQAMEMIGIGRDLFDELEKNLPFTQIKRRKMFEPDDIRNALANLKKESPCINHRKGAIRNRHANIETTRIYEHVEISQKKLAVEKIMAENWQSHKSEDK